jgi:hypothetical protein
VKDIVSGDKNNWMKYAKIKNGFNSNVCLSVCDTEWFA